MAIGQGVLLKVADCDTACGVSLVVCGVSVCWGLVALGFFGVVGEVGDDTDQVVLCLSATASAGPLRTPQGSHEQPDEVEPAHCSADQAHRDLEGAEQPLRQEISPAQQERPHGRRGDHRHPC